MGATLPPSRIASSITTTGQEKKAVDELDSDPPGAVREQESRGLEVEGCAVEEEEDEVHEWAGEDAGVA